MRSSCSSKAGFTIVELLIVIVVIAILATIAIVSYNGVQARAQQAKIDTDIATILKAVHAARASESKTLAQLTGSTASGGSCWSQPNGTDLAALPSSNTCWSRYLTSLSIISDVSGVNIRNLVDPWGRPYLIDENEGESGGCTRDTIAVYKRPFTTGFGVYSTTPANAVPLSGYTGC